MSVRIVQSKQNNRVKELRRALANPVREKGGPAGIEGLNLLFEAVRSGLRILCVFASEGNEGLLEKLALPAETEVLIVPQDVLRSALTTETPQPIAALVEPPDWTWHDVLKSGNDGMKGTVPLLLVLSGLQDPGNLGTIVRSAEAFGAQGVLCLPGTVSAWNPKAVRASAGSIFRVPILTAKAKDSIELLRESGLKMYAATARAAQPVDLANLAEPVAILIGNEGNGVPEELAAQADGAVTIPCPGPVESLNAAVAASVLLYEASRQRLMQRGGPLNHRGGSR